MDYIGGSWIEVLVELCGIEPQSENGAQEASTCLETLFEFQTTIAQRAKLHRPIL